MKSENGLTLGKKIEQARLRNRLNQSQLAEKVGVSPQTVWQWENDVTVPRSKRLEELANILHVRQDYLLPVTITSEGPSASGTLVPLITWEVKSTEHKIIDWLGCPVPHSASTYALNVKGESMTRTIRPSFYEGDIIFVDPEKEAVNQSLVIVDIEGNTESAFRQLLIEGDQKLLKALNPAWPEPLAILADNAVIRGVVIFKGEII